MSNKLRSRLNRLSGKPEPIVGETDLASEMAESGGSQLEQAVDGIDDGWAKQNVFLQHTEQGSFLLKKSIYPLDHVHGAYQLAQLLDVTHVLDTFCPGREVTSEQLLFLDLETTGLGSGTGNIPFLTSIGYVEQHTFVLEQALICHPVEEYAMLTYMLEKMVSRTYLVTYNGKSFDWPLLQNRMVMNRLRKEHWRPQHIDLLHPSRAVWRNTLTSCKLSYVEEKRLGIERVDDIPGSLAPQLYFQYLAEQNPTLLAGVLQHNEWDILSLVTLLIRFGQLLNGELEQLAARPIQYEEIVRTGLWLEKMKVVPLAERYYQLARETEGVTSEAAVLLATRHKKAGNWSEAVLLWQKVLIMNSSAIDAKLGCYVELAKYYEHRDKQYAVALDYMVEAEQAITSNRYSGVLTTKQRQWLDECQHRINRLRLKLKE